MKLERLIQSVAAGAAMDGLRLVEARAPRAEFDKVAESINAPPGAERLTFYAVTGEVDVTVGPDESFLMRIAK